MAACRVLPRALQQVKNINIVFRTSSMPISSVQVVENILQHGICCIHTTLDLDLGRYRVELVLRILRLVKGGKDFSLAGL